jgi:hypothetical protein
MASEPQGDQGVPRPQNQYGIRKRNVHEQPTVQNLMQAALFIQLSLLLADIFQIIDAGVKIGR